MKKYLLYSLTFLFISLFTSCVKQEQENLNHIGVSKLGENYLKFLSAKKAVGSIMIQSNTSLKMQNLYKGVNISEKKGFRNEDKNNSKSKVFFKDFEKEVLLKNKANFNSEQLFGQKINYIITEGSSYGKGGGDTSSVYIPQLLNISINTQNLRTGSEVTWNIDPLNQNGVAIQIEYNAINQLSSSISQNNPQSIRRAFVLPDTDGSYIVKAEDLAFFPNNSFVTVNIMRAGGNINDNSMSVIGMTNIRADLILQ